MCVCVQYAISLYPCTIVTDNDYVSIIAFQWLCSALKKITRNRQDRNIKKTTKLLLKTIANHWTTLAPRVESQFSELEEAERQIALAERLLARAERIQGRRMKNEEDR